MTKKTQGHLITFGMALGAAALMVWASNNVPQVGKVLR